ncbi:cobyric acid synthase CobQ [Anoxybacter fermentans]|uniref:Cobyric acid synthase n=1 Tax=Anoxybacter fermentans TaxID=1323375 RepID=A0A3Q9HSV6_9FIRM|nr:cobyric acid synthase [Anoxybacter fermentans]AZR74549.1 cobyric acid synthase CobQ [Anoxybacter fermentans]
MRGSIMLQGTASSVGKSLLAAAFCRIFYQDGYKVAPFKAQNMALNSFITKDGFEMGRAQVFQAEAAGIEPRVEMNPILLKPTTDVGAQVIIKGKVASNMLASEYFRYKSELKEMVKETYKKLAEEFEIIVIEGAGSPAEINLKSDDIVNMGMAKMAKSPVILIGDIDRGGVFASLYGTIMLLEPEERALVKGVIINKFRGDVKLLEPGLKQLEKLINVPVLGVVPYINVQIDDEDSVTERFQRRQKGEGIKIQVILLPYISNFTDFTPLEMEEDVILSYVRRPEELDEPDMVIIPGSKNTLNDRLYLQRMGWDGVLRKYAHSGGLLMGICGGYQILGKMFYDPHGAESSLRSLPGLGLLQAETEMAKEKTTRQIKGIWAYEDNRYFAKMKGIPISGYEIHMGQTILGEEVLRPIYLDSIDEWEGGVNKNGNIVGTYLHGIFENLNWTRQLLNNLRRLKGMKEKKGPVQSYWDFKEAEYNRLAQHVRNHVNIERIYQIIAEGVNL